MDKLKKIYNNVSNPGSYGSVDGLYRVAREKGLKVTVKNVRDFLSTQDTYTLHRKALKRFKRNRTIVYGIDEQWQIDLADLKSLTRHNRGYRYLLCCIDIFSKFAFVVATKNKKGSTILKAFKSILKYGRTPSRIQSDSGKEFIFQGIQRELKRRRIEFFIPDSELKATVIERFNRTLKTRMYRYFTENNTFKYIHVLKDMVKAYNHSYHRSIKCKPVEVTAATSKRVWENLYGDVNFTPPTTYPFDLADVVRISTQKHVFEKGYFPTWSEELFKISERLPRSPPVYKIRALNDEVITGIFYREQLQKVGKDLTNCPFKIEKVLRKRRKVDGSVERLVRWKGYPPSFDSWVQEVDLK